MAHRRTRLDTEIQRLYGLPLGEFTAARNALARRLRKEEKRDDAEKTAALPKPSGSAWAVNHLFTADPEGMDRLLSAGEGARAALQKILSGGDPGDLRNAIQEARELADTLRVQAIEALTDETGRRPGPDVVDRIGTNLQSLAFSPAAGPVIERRWLDEDLPPPGFEVLAGLQLAAAPHPRASRATEEPHPDRKPAEDRQEERRAKEQEQAAVRAREKQERAEARLRERLAKARAKREEAAGRADFLRRKAEQAENVAEEARERADETEQIAADARKRSDDAERALARADQALVSAQRVAGGAGK